MSGTKFDATSGVPLLQKWSYALAGFRQIMVGL